MDDRWIQLLDLASLVLWKFTEGEEDWTEWRALAEAIEAAIEDVPDGDWRKRKIVHKLQDFNERLTAELVTAEERDDAPARACTDSEVKKAVESTSAAPSQKAT